MTKYHRQPPWRHEDRPVLLSCLPLSASLVLRFNWMSGPQTLALTAAVPLANDLPWGALLYFKHNQSGQTDWWQSERTPGLQRCTKADKKHCVTYSCFWLWKMAKHIPKSIYYFKYWSLKIVIMARILIKEGNSNVLQGWQPDKNLKYKSIIHKRLHDVLFQKTSMNKHIWMLSHVHPCLLKKIIIQQIVLINHTA